jgi:copper oxidase (laccase) domain-containing protein
VEAMADRFGSRPGDLVAGIGPAIGVCCYEVGEDVAREARKAFPHAEASPGDGPLSRGADGRWRLDLWAANRRQLEYVGVRPVEVAGTCTACHTEEWFSHRAERGKTGRWGAVIGLRE